MSDIGKVRVRLPSSIKAGDVVHVRSLVIHPMERVERDSKGKIIDKKYLYINRVVATYLGKTVAAFDTTQSVSENPTFVFSFRARLHFSFQLMKKTVRGKSFWIPSRNRR